MIHSDLAARLHGVAGITVEADAGLARLSTFRIGGQAEWLVEVETEAALATLVEALRVETVPFQLVGLGSNVLFPDEGLPGAVVRLTGAFLDTRYENSRVVAGAAVALPKLARRTASRGLSGLEPLCGFPSTVGGAVLMNAGCYGTEIKDVLVSCRVLNPDGTISELETAELEPGYRSTNLQEADRIVLSALFELGVVESDAAMKKIDLLNEKRWASLPSGRPNVGSIFKNPTGDYAGRLIEACGLKGRLLGGAQISPEHANVIVNVGAARAEDVLGLMITARNAVLEQFSIELEPEVVLAGNLKRRWATM